MRKRDRLFGVLKKSLGGKKQKEFELGWDKDILLLNYEKRENKDFIEGMKTLGAESVPQNGEQLEYVL